jgi:hypothetical protein
MHNLPRKVLDRYQPLMRRTFHGYAAPEIDYFTGKFNLVTTLIDGNRTRGIENYAPVSTAFVTFSDPRDAKRACQYLPSHPDNRVDCVVQMAPNFEDLDWTRIMKSTFKAEVSHNRAVEASIDDAVQFIKDWVVNLGVWCA